MRVYVSSPSNQLQCHALNGLPALISFACEFKFMNTGGYAASFSRLLLDSGAYSEFTTGKPIDIKAYVDWVQQYPWADAWAGLDSIDGNWKRSLKNYEHGGFPTFHDTDPDWLLDELIPMARERGHWIGVGLKPPRTNREPWLRRTLDRIPDDLHVHGWALGRYLHLPFDSWDSTHAWREYGKLKQAHPWLTNAECIDLAVLKMQRMARQAIPIADEDSLLPLDIKTHSRKEG